MFRFELVLSCVLLVLILVPPESNGQDYSKSLIDSLRIPFANADQENSTTLPPTPTTTPQNKNCSFNPGGALGTNPDFLNGEFFNNFYAGIAVKMPCLWKTKDGSSQYGLELGFVLYQSFSSAIEPYTFPVYLRRPEGTPADNRTLIPLDKPIVENTTIQTEYNNFRIYGALSRDLKARHLSVQLYAEFFQRRFRREVEPISKDIETTLLNSYFIESESDRIAGNTVEISFREKEEGTFYQALIGPGLAFEKHHEGLVVHARAAMIGGLEFENSAGNAWLLGYVAQLMISSENLGISFGGEVRGEANLVRGRQPQYSFFLAKQISLSKLFEFFSGKSLSTGEE